MGSPTETRALNRFWQAERGRGKGMTASEVAGKPKRRVPDWRITHRWLMRPRGAAPGPRRATVQGNSGASTGPRHGRGAGRIRVARTTHGRRTDAGMVGF